MSTTTTYLFPNCRSTFPSAVKHDKTTPSELHS